MNIRKIYHEIGNYFRKLNIIYLRSFGIKIGKNTFISYNAWIDKRRGKVIIGDNCTITNGCKILSHSAVHNLLHPDIPEKDTCTVLEDNVFIGMNSIVLPNIRIGHNSIIGAGSVVTKNIPPYSVAAGNPAVILKKYDKDKKKWVPYQN